MSGLRRPEPGAAGVSCVVDRRDCAGTGRLAVCEADPDLSVREGGRQVNRPGLERSAQTRDDFGQDPHVLRPLGAAICCLELAFEYPGQDRRVAHGRPDRLVPRVVCPSVHRTDVLIDPRATQVVSDLGSSSPTPATGRRSAFAIFPPATDADRAIGRGTTPGLSPGPCARNEPFDLGGIPLARRDRTRPAARSLQRRLKLGGLGISETGDIVRGRYGRPAAHAAASVLSDVDAWPVTMNDLPSLGAVGTPG
jgi:hypothetical protein